MELTREEQETNILTNAASREWDFWTFDPIFVRRLTKLGWELKKDHQGGWSCKIPLDRIGIKRPEKRKPGGAALARMLGKTQKASPAIDPKNQTPPAMI